MLNQDLNQFVKYDEYSSYLTKTQVKFIESRNPLDYYNQNNIQTQNWDSSLLQTKPQISRELDKINNLVDSLFTKNESQQKPKQELKERNQRSFFEKSSPLGNLLTETIKSVDVSQQQQQQQQPFCQNQSLMNLQSNILNVRSISMKQDSCKQRIQSNVQQVIEQKGLNQKQSIPLNLYELRQINNIEIQKALKVLKK